MSRHTDLRPLSANALRVLEARYLARDQAGRALEDWDGLCARVAGAVAACERDLGADAGRVEAAFRDALCRREFLPNSPTLMNAGTEVGQLSACFVLPLEDSLESIFEAVKRMALIHQSGGGTGFSFSRLRPAGDRVSTTMDAASGPVSFLRVFDATTNVIKQGGRRRGANMGVLRVDHPDIREFVACKRDPEEITNFNLSVGATDAFLRAAQSGGALDLANPRDGKVVESIDARALLDEIAENAWAGGDPGLIFLDALNRENPTPRLGPLEATNPCGELPLLPNESCNLGSLRLDAFAREGGVDWERLDAAVDLGVRFLDDVIESNRLPGPELAEMARRNRKIGLGVMGFADLLVDLGVPYDSEEAVRVAERLMARIRARAESASAALARTRGTFPEYAGSRAEARGLPLRNATVTSIAPTGTISILADCSSGIEPYFALSYTRHALDGEALTETSPRLRDALRRAGETSSDLLAEVRARGTVRDVAGVPEPVRRLFPTALDMTPDDHLAIQAGFQRHVDNAVSKTINLPARSTPEDVARVYVRAWELGLKGITIFREGCKGRAVLIRGSPGDALECDTC